MTPPLFPATLALYAVACALYLAHLMTGSEGLARAGRGALAAAFVCQAVDIGWLGTKGVHPGSSAREAMSSACEANAPASATRAARASPSDPAITRCAR